MGLICAYNKTLNNECVKSEKIISIGYILAENQANEKILHMTYIYVTVSWEQHVMTYIYMSSAGNVLNTITIMPN